MLPYSKEMHRHVLAACDRGEGTRVVALRFEFTRLRSLGH
jgi:hypothetical protein